MISRRLLRLKIMQIIYANFKRSEWDLNKTEKELFYSINKTYELYHYLLLLIIDIKFYAENKLEIRKNKFLKSNDRAELSENFINNKLIKLLEINNDLNKFLNNNKFNWQLQSNVLAHLFNELEKTQEFREYLLLPNPDINADKKIITFFFTHVLVPSQNFNQALEELSIFWNDELEFVVSNVIATINKFTEDKGAYNQLMNMYKSPDDIDFTKNLFRKTIIHHDEHNKIIQKFLKNWEVDRIAQIDMILIEMALTEFYYLDEIPIKVTLNEYIELSKFYSTEKSNSFINGILDKIVHAGREDGKIVKKGKGLIGEENG